MGIFSYYICILTMKFNLDPLQQNVSLYAKWFHKILSVSTSPSEWNLVGM
jgi:hypothetical protein